MLNAKEINKAAELILKGELVSFQTETVYGLGADATNDEAVRKIYQAKGRPNDNPLIVHVANKEQVIDYVEKIPEKAKKLMDAFWPGPLTIVLKKKEGVLAPTVTAGLESVGIRMPDSLSALHLIEASGKPLAAPSANTSGKPSPTSAQHVFHDLNGKIAAILDDGETGVGLESTVLDMTNPDQPLILRPGGVSKEALDHLIGPVFFDKHLMAENETPKAPGMKYKHYSPEEPVYIVSEKGPGWAQVIDTFKKKGEKIGLLASDEVISRFGKEAISVYSLGSKGDAKAASHSLFAGLRHFETTEATIILAEAYTQSDIGQAFMNRLEKAAGKKYL